MSDEKDKKHEKIISVVGGVEFDMTEIIMNIDAAKAAKQRVEREKILENAKSMLLIVNPKERVNDDMGPIMAKIVDICIDRETSWPEFKSWCINNCHWIKEKTSYDERLKKDVTIPAAVMRERYAYNVKMAINTRESLLDDTVQTMLDFLELELFFVDREEAENMKNGKYED